MKREIYWVDGVRALCVILVYFAHSVAIGGFGIPLAAYRLYDFVYVNGFFFVSGYLLFGKQLSHPVIGSSADEFRKGEGKKLLENVLFRIVIPAVIFSLIEYFPKRLIRGGGFDILSFVTETIGGGTYWFLSALAVAELLLLLMLLTRIRTIWFYVGCSVILAIAGMLIERSGFGVLDYDPTFPWKYKQGMVCLIYLAAGGLYQRYVGDRPMPAWLFIGLTCIYVAGCIWLPIGDMSVYYCSVQPSGFAWSILGIVVLVELCRRLPKLKLITFVGRNSILFYLMSGALPTVLTAAVSRFFSMNLLALSAIFIISFAAACVLSRLIVRYMPFLKDLRGV